MSPRAGRHDLAARQLSQRIAGERLWSLLLRESSMAAPVAGEAAGGAGQEEAAEGESAARDEERAGEPTPRGQSSRSDNEWITPGATADIGGPRR